MANLLPPDDTTTKYIVYVDEKSRLVAFDRATKSVVDFKEETMLPEIRKTLYQVFIGADVKQKRKAKFLVTIGNQMTTSKAIQAFMRLRGLPEEQTVDLAISEEVAKTISQMVGRKKEDLSFQDVMAYCMINEERFAKKDVLLSEKQKIGRYPTVALTEARVRLAAEFAGTIEEGITLVSDIHEAFADVINPDTSVPIEKLASRETSTPTKTSLEGQKADALTRLEAFEKTFAPINSDEKILEPFQVLQEKLAHREETPAELMPEHDEGSLLGDANQVGIAVAQQQVEQQVEQQAEQQVTATETSKAKRKQFSIWVPWNKKGKPAQQVLDEVYHGKGEFSFFNDIDTPQINISINISFGKDQGLYKDISHAVFIDGDEGIKLFCMDQLDYQEYLKYVKEISPKTSSLSFYPVVLGPTSYIEGKIPEEKQQECASLLVQAKLLAGITEFETDQEKSTLKDVVSKMISPPTKLYGKDAKTIVKRGIDVLGPSGGLFEKYYDRVVRKSVRGVMKTEGAILAPEQIVLIDGEHGPRFVIMSNEDYAIFLRFAKSDAKGNGPVFYPCVRKGNNIDINAPTMAKTKDFEDLVEHCISELKWCEAAAVRCNDKIKLL
jgi:hypothetical protein